MPGKTPTLSQLYHLAEQLELDKELPVQTARERDHAIAVDCSAGDDSGRLLFWLDAVSAQRRGADGSKEPWLSEASAAALGRLLALFFGFSGMAAFLLTSGRGLVNVFMFLLLFVVIQFLLCLVAAVVMAFTLGPGQAPVVLPLNPARLLVARAFPDRRYLREAQSVVRLVFLRYGQELGALFTLGAIAAFFVVLALSDFTFVWGSTFQLSDSLVEDMTAALAAPWSAWLPQATVGGDLIFATRFHPAITSLGPDNIEAMRGWWPFLIMSMLCYALFPRLLLWLLSRYFYGQQMRTAITRLPGSERVLARMKTPLVRTQGEGAGARPPARDISGVPVDQGLLLLNWANALTPEDVAAFEAFAAVADGNIVNAGLGPVPAELERLASRFDKPVEQLFVATKSWEPPMADLADFLGNFARVPRCTLFLVPLPHKPVSAARLGDWQVFARALPFDLVDVQALERG
ncbi:MAG: DUF2868 domain-containing protein [Halieaceae bacterium]|jgi:hypothetical protein|nr:DUF2868 domain-containing protein [Halieaceae bacterium]